MICLTSKEMVEIFLFLLFCICFVIRHYFRGLFTHKTVIRFDLRRFQRSGNLLYYGARIQSHEFDPLISDKEIGQNLKFLF